MADKFQTEILAGSTDVTIYVLLRSTTNNQAVTGKAYGDVTGSYCRALAVRAAITMATQTVTGAHSDGGFVEIDATNQPGLYRFDIPDAAFASGVESVIVSLVVSGAYVVHREFRIGTKTSKDNNDLLASGTYGLSALKTLIDTLTAYVDTEVAAILEDTGTTLPATLSTIAGYIDTEVAAIKAVTDALLDKLLAYVQLLARKDAAIASDRATELTAINADQGSGAGAFANTTDAQEAIRDNQAGADAAAIADAVCDEALSGHTSAGTVGKALSDILADTDELQADDTPAALAALDAKIDIIDANVDSVLEDTGTTLPATLSTIAGYLDTEVAAILEDTGTTIPGLIAALENVSSGDVQTACAAALTAYDPPTKAEMDAAHALLATAASLATTDGKADSILEDTGTTLPGTLSTIAGYLDTEIAAILEDTGTTIPGLIAALENLSASEAAAAVLDDADGIETGYTPRQAIRVMAAIIAGLLSGGGTGTETFKGLDQSTTRAVATVDASGNRSAIVVTKGA